MTLPGLESRGLLFLFSCSMLVVAWYLAAAGGSQGVVKSMRAVGGFRWAVSFIHWRWRVFAGDFDVLSGSGLCSVDVVLINILFCN